MCAIERLDIFPPYRSKELQPEAKGGAKVNADSAAFVNFIYLKKLKIEDVNGSGELYSSVLSACLSAGKRPPGQTGQWPKTFPSISWFFIFPTPPRWLTHFNTKTFAYPWQCTPVQWTPVHCQSQQGWRSPRSHTLHHRTVSSLFFNPLNLPLCLFFTWKFQAQDYKS